MRLLEPVDEAVVVHAFLRAELDSERFGAQLRASLGRFGASPALIVDPDFGDAVENERRRAVLDDYRGDYLGRNLYLLAWRRALLAPADVLEIRTIAWDFWLEVTGGTRLPADAAAHFRALGEDDESFRPGGPPLIVVRSDASAHLMVVEGHGRLVALAGHPETLPPELEVLLGEGQSLRSWSLY